MTNRRNDATPQENPFPTWLRVTSDDEPPMEHLTAIWGGWHRQTDESGPDLLAHVWRLARRSVPRGGPEVTPGADLRVVRAENIGRFQRYNENDHSTLFCTCGDTFRWTGVDERLDPWVVEHAAHLDTMGRDKASEPYSPNEPTFVSKDRDRWRAKAMAAENELARVNENWTRTGTELKRVCDELATLRSETATPGAIDEHLARAYVHAWGLQEHPDVTRMVPHLASMLATARAEEPPRRPAPPETSTGWMTGDEIAIARGLDKLRVDANGMGFVPTEWLREWRKRTSGGESPPTREGGHPKGAHREVGEASEGAVAAEVAPPAPGHECHPSGASGTGDKYTCSCGQVWRATPTSWEREEPNASDSIQVLGRLVHAIDSSEDMLNDEHFDECLDEARKLVRGVLIHPRTPAEHDAGDTGGAK